SREWRLVTTRNIIELAAGTRATIVEAHVTLPGAAPGQANTLSEVLVGEGAHLAHLGVTLAGDAASHLATWLATLGEKATYRAFQLTAATGLARSNLFVTFKGEGA